MRRPRSSRRTPGVLSVAKDELRTRTPRHTPAFLGLTDRGGLWDQLGGARDAGDGVVVGIVDSGIWPENPSFAGDDRHGHGHGGPHDHHHGGGYGQSVMAGTTSPGHIHGLDRLSAKTARTSSATTPATARSSAPVTSTKAGAVTPASTHRGPGSSTPRATTTPTAVTRASTAAGNYKVKTDGPPAALGRISGMAPGARIAVYKALWSTQGADLATGYTPTSSRPSTRPWPTAWT